MTFGLIQFHHNTFECVYFILTTFLGGRQVSDVTKGITCVAKSSSLLHVGKVDANQPFHNPDLWGIRVLFELYHFHHSFDDYVMPFFATYLTPL